MRHVFAAMVLAVLAGCMHYDGRDDGQARGDQGAGQVPPGKMWVQDVETGEFVLVDDPNAEAPMPEVAPAPRRIPLPPSPRAVARRVRGRIAPPPVPGAMPVEAARRPRPKLSISAELWAMEVEGTASGHSDWPTEDADLGSDLNLDNAIAVSLDAALIIPEGPRFRIGLTAIQGEGDPPPDITFPAGETYEASYLGIVMFDFAFTPMARGEKWGSVALEMGFRYARASVEIFEDKRFAEGTMLTLGGELDLVLQRRLLYGDVSASVGLGPDSGYLQFDAGISLKPSPVFGMRLGYRFLGLVLADRFDEADERRLGVALGGPTLELGLTF